MVDIDSDHQSVPDNPEFYKPPEFMRKTGGQELLVEALVLSRMSESPHIPNLEACYPDSAGNIHLVTEFIPGRSLGEIIGLEVDWRSRPVEPDQANRIITSIAKPFVALNEAGIIYRDLNFDHVILSNDGLVVLVDHARDALPDEDGNCWNYYVKGEGTWETMAPEEFESRAGSRLGPEVNVYALGVVFYQMLVGRNPFHVLHEEEPVSDEQYQLADERHSRLPDSFEGIPEAVLPIIRKALHPDPASRFPNVRAFIEAVQTSES